MIISSPILYIIDLYILGFSIERMSQNISVDTQFGTCITICGLTTEYNIIDEFIF